MTSQPRLRAFASPIDRLGEPLAARVVLHDVTLREGLEAATAPVPFAGRLRLAMALAEAGIDEIQVGYLGRSAEDRRLVAALRANGVATPLEGIVAVGGDHWQEEIDAALEASPDRLNAILPVSAARLEGLGMATRHALERITCAVAYASERCRVCFTPVDATRADPELLVEVACAVEASGADRCYVIDTAGIVSPAGMRALVGRVRRQCSMTLAVHCHDDLGLAVANGLAAVEAGAEVIDVCVNGMGKRAGNLALEEIAVALSLFHNTELRLRLDHIATLAELAAQLSGVVIPDAKALIGRAAFEGRVDGLLSGQRGHDPMPLIDPAIIGRGTASALAPSAGR